MVSTMSEIEYNLISPSVDCPWTARLQFVCTSRLDGVDSRISYWDLSVNRLKSTVVHPEEHTAWEYALPGRAPLFGQPSCSSRIYLYLESDRHGHNCRDSGARLRLDLVEVDHHGMASPVSWPCGN